MEDREGDSEHTEGTRFLPPEPAGPEPELSDPPPKQEPPQHSPQETYGYPPQPAGAQQQYAPPPPGQPYYPPPGYGYPPPGQGYAPPPPGQGYPPWGYAQQVPDNGQAVAGFVLSLVSAGLLFISMGLSSIVSIGCAIAGIVCSRNGKKKVDRGETPKHRGLAQAGFIIGWISLVLSVLATVGWIVFIVVAATDENFDLEEYETVTAALAAARLGARLLGA